MSIHRSLLSSGSLIATKAKRREGAFLKIFSQSFSDKTLFVTTLLSSCVPDSANLQIPQGQKNIYILLDIGGTDFGKFLDSGTAFSSAIKNGYEPQWAH